MFLPHMHFLLWPPFPPFILSCSRSCLSPVGGKTPPSVLPAYLQQPTPVLSADSCSQGSEQPVMAVPWGKHHTHLLSQPCPALRRGRGTPHRETGWEHEGAQAGGPPLVGETEWISRQCPPLSCRLGWSREGPSVTRPRAPLQGGSHPTAPRQRRLPLPPALHTVGPLPSAVVPLSLIAWPDLELHFDAMKTLCLYIMFIYFKDLCQESIFNKNQNDFFSPAGVSSSALTLIP